MCLLICSILLCSYLIYSFIWSINQSIYLSFYRLFWFAGTFTGKPENLDGQIATCFVPAWDCPSELRNGEAVYTSGNFSSKGGGIMRTLQALAQKVDGS